MTPSQRRDQAALKPVFDFGYKIDPQPDPAVCPVYDVRHSRWTGRPRVYRCSLPVGHRGACDCG